MLSYKKDESGERDLSEVELGDIGASKRPTPTEQDLSGLEEGSDKKGEEEADVCCICLELPATNTLEPCGHKVICDTPACREVIVKHNRCPLCRDKPNRLVDQDGIMIVALKSFARYAGVPTSVPFSNQEQEEQVQEQSLMERATAKKAKLIKGLVEIILWICAPYAMVAYLEGKLNQDFSGKASEFLRLSILLVLIYVGVMVASVLVGGAFGFLAYALKSKSEGLSYFLMVVTVLATITAMTLLPPLAVQEGLGGHWLSYLYAMASMFLGSVILGCFRISDEELERHQHPFYAHTWNFFITICGNLIAAVIFSRSVSYRNYMLDPTNNLRNVSLIAGACNSLLMVPLLSVVFPDLFADGTL